MLRELSDVTICRARSHEAFLRTLAAAGAGPLVSLLLRPDAQILWRRHALDAARGIAARHSIDLVYTSVQPWSSALVGMELKRTLGVPWVLDFRDLWAECTHAAWPTRVHHALDRSLERRAIGAADAIVVATPGMAEILRRAHPDHAERVHTITNGYDAEDIPDSPLPLPASRPTVAFAGRFQRWRQGGVLRRLGRALGHRNCVTDFPTHSPLYLLRAIAALLAERPELARRLRVELTGQIGRDNAELVTQWGLGRIVAARGRQTHADVIAALREADVLFLPMMCEADGRRSYNVSGKIFEYLALGKPILAAVPEGDASDVVRRSGAGWVVAPHDVEGMQELLARLIERRWETLRSIHRDEAYIRQFERRALTGQLAGLFDELLDRPARPVPVRLNAGQTQQQLQIEGFRL